VSHVRRLDHVGILVADIDRALEHFRDRLELAVVHTEELEEPRVQLAYLDAGNVFIQLIQPLDDDGDLARSLVMMGEGVHHLCFGVDDPVASATRFSLDERPPGARQGRGRVSAFVPGPVLHGVRLECTEFDLIVDVEHSPGWLSRSDPRTSARG
jgi:methylmalonyl-CoA epimerase